MSNEIECGYVSSKEIDAVFDFDDGYQASDSWDSAFSSLEEEYNEKHAGERSEEEERIRLQTEKVREMELRSAKVFSDIENLLKENLIETKTGPRMAYDTGQKLEKHLKHLTLNDLELCFSQNNYQTMLMALWEKLPLDRKIYKTFEKIITGVNLWESSTGRKVNTYHIKEVLKIRWAEAPDALDPPIYRTIFVPICLIVSSLLAPGASFYALIPPCVMLAHMLLERCFHTYFRRKTSHLLAMILVTLPLCIFWNVYDKILGNLILGTEILAVFYAIGIFSLALFCLGGFLEGTEFPYKNRAAAIGGEDSSTLQAKEIQKLRRRLKRATYAYVYLSLSLGVNIIVMRFLIETNNSLSFILWAVTSMVAFSSFIYVIISFPLRRSYRILRKNGHSDLISNLDLLHPFDGHYGSPLSDDRNIRAFHGPGILYLEGAGILVATCDILRVYEQKSKTSAKQYYFELRGGQTLRMAVPAKAKQVKITRYIQQDQMNQGAVVGGS